jgi:hypothetical protein
MKLCYNDKLLPTSSTTITRSLTFPSETSSSNNKKRMKHFHAIDDENNENANTSDGEPPAFPPSDSKPPVPRIKIRLRNHSVRRKKMQGKNGFDLAIQPFNSSSSAAADEDDEEESIQSYDYDESFLSESSSCSDIVPTSKKQPKRVSFGVVQVQEYELTLGDHPFSSSYPLSLDWPHTAEKEYDLDLFERVRQTAMRNSSRSRPCKHLTPNQRRSRLSTVSGINPTDLAKQDQLRHQQLLSELEQLYYSDSMDIDDEGEGYYTQPEPSSPRNSEIAWPSQARVFWENDDDNDQLFEMDDFEPIKMTRSKSMTGIDSMDISILDSLYESDEEEEGSGAFRDVTCRRGEHRQAAGGHDGESRDECPRGNDRRKSSPW